MAEIYANRDLRNNVESHKLMAKGIQGICKYMENEGLQYVGHDIFNKNNPKYVAYSCVWCGIAAVADKDGDAYGKCNYCGVNNWEKL